MFAEHTREVLGQLLGMSEAEVQRLYEVNATADEPKYPEGSIAAGI
jgi:hypothetical protein